MSKTPRTTDDAIQILKNLPGFKSYHRYFESKLAGDFAFELAKHLVAKEAEFAEARAEIERLKKFADEVLDGRDRAADKFARRIEEFNSETDILKSEIKRKDALIEQMQTAFKEILKIQRTVDLNLFDIEQVHSIAEAALSAAERGA